MSQPKTRRTAFARVPLNAPSTGPKSAPVIINAQYLARFEQCRLDRNLQDTLAKTQAELNFRVSPTGAITTEMIDRKGTVIGDKQDIGRVIGMNSFINQERKQALKENVSSTVKKILFSLNEGVKKDDPTWKQEGKISARMAEILRPVQNAAVVLSQNVGGISGLESSGATSGSFDTIVSYVVLMNKRIRNAWARFLLASFKDSDNKEIKLNDFLFDGQVPKWAYSRLTSQRISVNAPGFKLESVFFPSDPSKGFTLTYKEWRSSAMVDNQGGMLESNSFLKRLFSKDGEDLLRVLINFPEGSDLDTSDDAKLLENIGVLVVPPNPDVLGVVNQAAKRGPQGYSWSYGTSLTPRDNLRFVGTLHKRIVHLALPRALHQRTYIEELFPGFKYDPGNRSKNIFAQLAEDIKKDPTAHLLNNWQKTFTNDYLVSGYKKHLENGLRLILELPIEDKVVGAAIDSFLNKQDDKTFLPIRPAKPDKSVTYDKLWSSVKANAGADADLFGPIFQRAESYDTKGVVDKWVAQNFEGRLEAKEKKQSMVLNARTVLGVEGKDLVRKIDKVGLKPVSKRIDLWLRSFSTQKLQGAVAHLLYARFDQAFSNPLIFGRDDLAEIMDLSDEEGHYSTDDEESAEDSGGEESNPDDPMPK